MELNKCYLEIMEPNTHGGLEENENILVGKPWTTELKEMWKYNS